MWLEELTRIPCLLAGLDGDQALGHEAGQHGGAVTDVGLQSVCGSVSMPWEGRGQQRGGMQA